MTKDNSKTSETGLLITIPKEAEIIGCKKEEYTSFRAINYEAEHAAYLPLETNGFKMETGWSIYFKMADTLTFRPKTYGMVHKFKDEEFQTISIESVSDLEHPLLDEPPVIKLTNNGPYIYTVYEGKIVGEIRFFNFRGKILTHR